MSAAEIVAEVLAEHELELAYGVDVDGCSCGAFWLTTDDAWRQHVAQLVAERLQAADVGACGATGGEVGGNASDVISGALRAKIHDLSHEIFDLRTQLIFVKGERDKLRAKVAGLHRLVVVPVVAHDDHSRVIGSVRLCSHCSADDGFGDVLWPCPTALAVGIGGES